MRNRILYLTRSTIPYVKELQPLTGSIAGCILMQQLDYWFERYPDGFWKFLEECEGHANYKKGGSWCEELGMTRHEFHTAFDRIGVRHISKGKFEAAKDKFAGKYYCSYQDRIRNLTFYFRNHELLDKALDTLIQNRKQENTPHSPVTPESGFTITPNSGFTGKPETSSTEIHNSALQESRKPDLLNTEITGSEITQIPLLLSTDPAPPADTTGGSGIDDLIFPKGLSSNEHAAIAGMLLVSKISRGVQQQLVDELAGAIKANTIKRGVVPFMHGLITAASKGRFAPSLGVAVLCSRKIDRENIAREIQAKDSFPLNPALMERGEAILAAIKNRASKSVRTI
jgi:hypothetical protein